MGWFERYALLNYNIKQTQNMFGDRVTIALEAAYAPRIMRARDINHHINSIHGRFAMIYKLLEKQNENSEKDFKKSATIGMKMSSFRGVQLSYSQNMSKTLQFRMMGRVQLYDDARPYVFGDLGFQFKFKM